MGGAVSGFSLLGHLGRQILYRLGLLRDGVRDDRAGSRIDLQNRLAARALDVEHTFSHRTIVIELAPTHTWLYPATLAWIGAHDSEIQCFVLEPDATLWYTPYNKGN